MFQQSARELDSKTDEIVKKAFKEAKSAANKGKRVDVNLNRQRIEKSLLKIAFMNVEVGLNSNDVNRAYLWFFVLSLKFGFSEEPSPSSLAMAQIVADPSLVSSLKQTVLLDLLDRFAAKVLGESLEALEALEGGNSVTATEKAVEGQIYYRVIQPDLRDRLGKPIDERLAEQLKKLFEAAKEGKLTKASTTVAEISALLASYQQAL